MADNRKERDDALAAASLLLRHRLFPRAMAWNVQQQSHPTSPTAEQLLQTATQLLEQQQNASNTANHNTVPLDVARSFPLLQAPLNEPQRGYASYQEPAPPADRRERLFRSMEKYLDPPRAQGGLPSPDRMTAQQQQAFQAMKISSYADEERRSWAPVHTQARARESASRKRSRGSVPAVKDDEIAPSLARALLTGCGAKQCSFEGCKKIAVSKGLCRGHGGGRRCQHAGCTKCAQSRSPFCWAHGGGKRCEAPNCRRSRKTKRFCVDHVDMELTVPLKTSDTENSKPNTTKATKSPVNLSGGNKSSASYTSADSDDSVGKQSTISCDSSYSVAYKESRLIPPATEYITEEQKYAQSHQYAGEMSGSISSASLQLPSLNEALLRTIPGQYSADARWGSTTTTVIPSPPAPLSSQYKSGEYSSWPQNSCN